MFDPQRIYDRQHRRSYRGQVIQKKPIAATCLDSEIINRAIEMLKHQGWTVEPQPLESLFPKYQDTIVNVEFNRYFRGSSNYNILDDGSNQYDPQLSQINSNFWTIETDFLNFLNQFDEITSIDLVIGLNAFRYSFYHSSLGSTNSNCNIQIRTNNINNNTNPYIYITINNDSSSSYITAFGCGDNLLGSYGSVNTYGYVYNTLVSVSNCASYYHSNVLSDIRAIFSTHTLPSYTLLSTNETWTNVTSTNSCSLNYLFCFDVAVTGVLKPRLAN